jgi:cytochrome P450
VLAIVEECSEEFVDAPAIVDLKTSLTSVVPLAVIGELMALTDATAFPEWYHRIVAASVSNVTGDPGIHARGVAAREELFEFITPKIEARRQHPSDDLLSTLVTTEYEGERLSDDEVRSFTAFLMSAGIETTDRAMVNLLVALMLHPEQWRALQGDPDLVVPAIAEGLRYRAPVLGAIREAVAEVELGGATIRPGERLFLSLGSSNHDETMFADPGRFDITRFTGTSGGQFTQAAMLRSFGGGAHTCTGSLVAKVEMEEMLRHLLTNYDRLEFAGEVPGDVGFYLRSPASLEVMMHPAAA